MSAKSLVQRAAFSCLPEVPGLLLGPGPDTGQGGSQSAWGMWGTCTSAGF